MKFLVLFTIILFSCDSNTGDNDKSKPNSFGELPTINAAAAITEWNYKLFLFGGSNNYSGDSVYNTIYIYENDQWSLFDTMPDYSNWDIKLVRSADDVYIISGWQSNGGAIKKYNLATKVWTNLTRSVNLIQNYGTTAQLVGNKIYHFGSHGEVDVYDINLNSWSLKSQNTINYGYEYSLSSALYNGEIYVTGYADSIIYKYNTINDTWYNVYQMNMALTGSSLFVYNDQLYLCGGFDSDHYPRVLLDNTFIFNLSNKSWKDASFKMSQGLYFHSTVLKNNTLYIIGGLDLNDEAVNLFQQFTL